MPFGFHLTMDTLPSGITPSGGFRSALAVSSFRLRARLGLSIPSTLSGQRGITPAFGYDAPHPSVRGTLTLPNNALLSAHYGQLRPLLRHRYSSSWCRPFVISFPSGARFSRSLPKPVLSSCRLYTDCRQVRKQVASRLIPEYLVDSGFDSTL